MKPSISSRNNVNSTPACRLQQLKDSSVILLKKAKDLYHQAGRWQDFLKCSFEIIYYYRDSVDVERKYEELNPSVKLYEEMKGDDFPELYKIYENLAPLCFRKGDFTSGRRYFDRCFELIEKYGSDPWLLFRSYRAAATAYYTCCKFDEALKYVRLSEEEIERKKGRLRDSQIKQTCILFANIYQGKGKYDSALVYLNKAIEAEKQNPFADSFNLGTLYNQLGMAYFGTGQYQKAVDSFEKAVELKARIEGTAIERDLAITFRHLSTIFMAKGDYFKALEYQKKALRMRWEDTPGGRISMSMIYMDISRIYLATGDLESALDYALKSADYLLREDKTLILASDALLNLGQVYLSYGKYDKALESYNTILDLFGSRAGIDSVKFGHCFFGLAKVYDAMDDSVRAMDYYKKALHILSGAFGNINTHVAGIYSALGYFCLKHNSPFVALKYFQSALKSNNPGFITDDLFKFPNDRQFLSPLVQISAFRGRALSHRKIYSLTGDIKELKKAHSAYFQNVTLLRRIRLNYLSINSKLLFSENFMSVFDEALDAAYELYKVTGSVNTVQAAFYAAEQNKSTILTDAFSESMAKSYSGIPDSLIVLDCELRNDIGIFSQMISLERQKNNPDSLLIGKLDNLLFTKDREYTRLVKYLEENYSQYYSLKYQPVTFSLAKIQRRLEKNTSLIEYYAAKDKLYIFVITGNGCHIECIPADSLYSSVDQLRSLLDNHLLIRMKNRKRFVELSRYLYDKLIRPVENNIRDKGNLVVIPDGNLYYLPFEVLLKNEPPSLEFSRMDYLLRERTVTYHYSSTLRSLIEETHTSNTGSGFLGFAPCFEDTLLTESLVSGNINLSGKGLRSSGFLGGRYMVGSLHYTRQEVVSISSLFRDKGRKSRLFLDSAATESNFRKALTEAPCAYLHIATHSFSNETDPSLSCILFSNPGLNRDKGDNILFSEEIFSLNINADLVVLSSCESGSGKLSKGEGVLAITRGFLYSGARNILFSLWQISDKYTCRLMTEFYRNNLSGLNYAKALRQAKLKLLRAEQTASPLNWSGFILIGK